MYSAYKLNKQGDSIQPWCTYSLPNFEPVHCFMSHSNCCFLTCVQVSQEAGQVVWYSRLFKNFPQFIVIHTVKGFSVVNEAEVDVFLEFCCFFCDPADVGNLVSSSSTFSAYSLNIWKSLVHVLLKPSLKNFEYYFASVLQEGIRGQTHWNHTHSKLVNLITLGPQPCLTQWNQAMPAGQPCGSWWRGLTECGPLEKGMASHFSIPALRTPWTVWKGKMIGYQKRNSPGH